MAAANFAERLTEAVDQRATPVLVGLDPRTEEFPRGMVTEDQRPYRTAVADGYLRFCREVIDVVAPLVPAVKPQTAFFEQLGPAGMSALAAVIRYARERGLLVIVDGKRNDIGSTAAAYADAYLGSGVEGTPASAWGADALTVSPYLGDDSLEPFVEVAVERGAGVFVLVKTSNPGGAMLQDLVVDGQPLYRHVGRHVEQLAARTASGGYGAVGAVVGATYPQQLAELRGAMPHTWFLVPGYGAQGAGAADVAAAFDTRGHGAIINSSRAIIFAYSREPYASRFGTDHWQEAIEAATRDMIGQLRAETPAGKLAKRLGS